MTTIRWIFAALCSFAVGRCVWADQIDVYVLTGQSNSLGTTADPQESDRTPGREPADDATMFFWDNVSAANSRYPIGTRYGDSAEIITTIQAQQGDGGGNPLFWGPEVGFARTMAHYGQKNIMIVKASRGGGGNAFWSKDAFESNANSGHMYQHVLDTVESAANELTSAGHSFAIKGLMYLQGESDDAAAANVSGERLNQLVSNLRSDLPNASALRAVVGGIGAAGGNRDIVRAQQSALALSDPTIDYFTNLDLVDSLYDNLHFDKPAKLEIGRRFAAAFLQAEGVLPLIHVTSFADVANAPDVARITFDDYVPDVNGNLAGVNLDHPGEFHGFVDGINSQPAVGLIVDTSDGNVVFADHVGGAPASDLSMGTFTPPPRSLDGTGGEDGSAIRFTFVDPSNKSQQATVASVAFNIGFVNPSDQITVSLLGIDGEVLHRAGVMPSGQFGFQSLTRLGGDLVSNIHRVVVAGNPGASFTVGTPGAGNVDLAYQGFQAIPEPSAALLYGCGTLFTLLRRSSHPHFRAACAGQQPD